MKFLHIRLKYFYTSLITNMVTVRNFKVTYHKYSRVRGSALRCKLEDGGFDSLWCIEIFY